MGVYLKDSASTWVPGPVNVADELYNQDLPDLSTDPDVIAGGDASVGEVDQRVGAGAVAAASPSLMRFVNRPGTEFFDSDITLPTAGQFHQSAGDQYNILFTVPVLATVVWDGNTPLSIQSWGTNGSSAVRQIGAIPAADAGVARSFVAILTPTGSRGSIFATGDGFGSHVVWISLQRLERFV